MADRIPEPQKGQKSGPLSPEATDTERYDITITIEGPGTRAAFELIRQMALMLLATAREEFSAGTRTRMKVLLPDRIPDTPGPR